MRSFEWGSASIPWRACLAGMLLASVAGPASAAPGTRTGGAPPAGARIALRARPCAGEYTLVRESLSGNRLLSRATEYLSLVVRTDPRGLRVTATLRRVRIEMHTGDGTPIQFDTAHPEGTRARNPMIREMADGLDKLLEVPMACVVDAAGRIVDDAGVAAARERLPGRGRAPGLATQVLRDIVQMISEGQELLPATRVAAGDTWKGTLTLPLGPGARTPVPVDFRIASLTAGTAEIAGVLTIDPAAIPASEAGRPLAADGEVTATFDVAAGRHRARASSLHIRLDSGAKGETHLYIRNTLTLRSAGR